MKSKTMNIRVKKVGKSIVKHIFFFILKFFGIAILAIVLFYLALLITAWI